MLILAIRYIKAKKREQKKNELSTQCNKAHEVISTPMRHFLPSHYIESPCVLNKEQYCPSFSPWSMCQSKDCNFCNANHDFVTVYQKYINATQAAKDAKEKYENTLRAIREFKPLLYFRGK